MAARRGKTRRIGSNPTTKYGLRLFRVNISRAALLSFELP
jgi:hypothetical protein